MYIDAREIPLTVVQIPFIASISPICKPRSWGTAVPLTRRSQRSREPQKQVEREGAKADPTFDGWQNAVLDKKGGVPKVAE